MDLLSSYMTPLLGGSILGTSSALLVALTGRITGVSGIFEGLLTLDKQTFKWKASYISGVIASSLLMSEAYPNLFALRHSGGALPIHILAIAGLLVGFGTRLSGGCTSGHGICGNSRLSKRSIAATLIFMTSGIAVGSVVVRTAAILSILITKDGLRR